MKTETENLDNQVQFQDIYKNIVFEWSLCLGVVLVSRWIKGPRVVVGQQGLQLGDVQDCWSQGGHLKNIKS